MVTIDDSLSETAGSAPEWWQPPRGIALPVALPLLLAGVLAIGVALTAAVSGDWVGGVPGAAADAGEVTLAAGPGSAAPGVMPVQVCGQIQQIVQTACGLKQHDHDTAGINACIAYELKYTMWSAYGCR